MKKLVSVFGPSDCPEGDPVLAIAERAGELLAIAGYAVVTGGYEGVMESVSKGARAKDGMVIGVTAEVYFARGREPNAYLTREVKVKSANDALMELIDIADAYIAIGNSTGTLIEVMTAWDYVIKRFIPEKPILLIGETWRHFAQYVHSDMHFAKDAHLVTYCPTPEAAMEILQAVFGTSMKLPDLPIIH